MSDTIGRISVPNAAASAVFPLRTEFPHGCARKRMVIAHQFGSANAKIEQRFYIGDGATRYTFHRAWLSNSDRAALRNFWEARQGAAGAFFYDVPNPDQTFTRKTVCFENAPLTLEELSDAACSVGLTLVEIPDPANAPVYSLGATVTRFPNHTLTDALLDQVQEIVPLVRIRVLDADVPDILLSDRRVTIRDSRGSGDPLNYPYLPRLLRIGEPGGGALVTQSIDGSSDDVTFSFGNADRVMVQAANDTQFRWARIELSLYHVPSTVRLDLWAGYIIDWQSDAGPEFTVRASDILSALTLSSPVGTVSRQCWRRLGQDGCLWSPASDTRDLTRFPAASTSVCDLGYNTSNGCLAHGAATTVPGYGATYCSPQGVLLRSGSIGLVAPGSAFPVNPFGWVGFGSKSTWYPRTSIVADTIYGQSLPEVWTNDDGIPQNALPVTCKIAAGRDEDEFYDALGIVGRGPLGAFTAPQMYDSDGDGKLDAFIGATLDGQPNHGFQVDSNGRLKAGANATYGLRQVLGTDPAGTHDWFSLSRVSATGNGWFTDAAGPMQEVAYLGSAYNLVFAAGVAFCEIRRTKPPKDPLSSPGQHTMIAAVSKGLTALGWTAPGARTTIPGCTNPFWVAANTFLSAIGLSGATASTQEEYFDVASAVAAATIADNMAPRIIGTGTEIQFRFKGSIDDRKPTRDWLQAILNSGCGYYVWSFGKLKVGCRENASAVSSFTAGNMIFNSLSLTPVIPKFEKLTVSFADEEYQFQSNTIDLTDQDHAARNNRSQNPLAGTFAISGCSTKSQAGRIAIVRSREELGGVTQAEQDSARLASWKTTILALETEAGMVVSVADPDIPTGTGKFRIQRWSLNRDWSIDIQGRTVTDSMYDMTVGPKPADVVASPIPTETPHATGLPLPWSPGYVAPLVGDAVHPAGLSGPGSFGVQPVYGVDAQGNGTISLAIKGTPPINQLSALASAVLPPSIACVAGTNGSLAPGTYVVAVSAFDTGTPYANTGYSNQVTVTIPAEPSTGSIALTVTWQPGSNGGDIYMASPDSDHSFHFQAGLAAGETTATVTSFNQSTAGGPDPKFDHLAVKWKKIVHGGVWAQQVQARTGTVGTSPGTITIADPSNGTTLNQWAGYTLSLLAKYDTTTEIKILNMPVLSNTAASGGLFVLTIGPNSVGDQLVDLTTLLDVGDLVVMRTKATFTPYGFSDPNIANAYYPSGMSGVEAGHLAMVMSGPDAGDVQTVGSVTLDGNGNYTVVNLAGAWETAPNPGDIVIIVEAAFSPEVKTQRFSIPNKGSFTGVVAQPNVLNLAGGAGAWLFLVATEDADNGRGPDSLAPARELYVQGSGGTRSISASATQISTDGLVECDTSAGNIVYTMLPFAQIPNRVIVVRKLTGDANTVTVQVDPTTDDSFPGGLTRIVLTDNTANYFTQIKVPG